MFHSDDYAALLTPSLDISVSLGNLCQRIASINDRSCPSRPNKLLEEHWTFSLFACSTSMLFNFSKDYSSYFTCIQASALLQVPLQVLGKLFRLFEVFSIRSTLVHSPKQLDEAISVKS